MEDLIKNAGDIADRRAAAVDSPVDAEKWQAFLAALSQRQRQIVQLWLQGLREPEIARRLGLTQRTVRRSSKKLRPLSET